MNGLGMDVYYVQEGSTSQGAVLPFTQGVTHACGLTMKRLVTS